jgi:probable phosphoglycerate mutase
VSRWLFVRHGESVANRENWLAGHRDVPLTAEGERQARALGPLLPAGIDRIWASDLQRAWRTAELAAPGRRVERYPALRERDLGTFEGRFRPELTASGEMALLTGWACAPPGAESQLDVARRILGFLAENDPEGTTLVVAHGGVLRVIEGLHLGTAVGQIGTRVITNTEVLEWELSRGRWAELAGGIDPGDDGPGSGIW